MGLDYGQAEITAFSEAAASGAIEYDPEAAREAVRLYGLLIEKLLAVRRRMTSVTEVSGFGGFDSAQELQKGFSTKASDGVESINQFIQGAVDLIDAYRHAGKLFTEEDQANADALQGLIAAPSEPGKPVI